MVNLWAVIEQDKEVQRVETQINHELSVVFDQAKKAGDIDTGLPNSWLVSFFDNTLTAGWILVEAGEATSTDAAHYVKHSFFNGCGKVQ